MMLWLWLVGPTATGLLLWGLWKWARLFWWMMWQAYYEEMARRTRELSK